jgi:FkbM family methyltransferase
MSIHFNTNSKKIKFGKKLGLHYPWRFLLKIYKLRKIPKFIKLLGYSQYRKLIIYRIKNSRKIMKLNLKGYKFPIFMRVNTSDFETFIQIFIDEEYNLKYDFIPNTIIDAGANCGYSILYFKHLFPNVKIIAIEPESSNVDMIQKNINFFKDVYVEKAGLWSSNSYLKIVNESANNWSFRVDEVKESESDLKGISVEYILHKYNINSIDIFKIDIEGSELELFKKNSEKWLGLVNLGFLELHERYAKGVTELVYTKLNGLKFKISSQGENLIFKK